MGRQLGALDKNGSFRHLRRHLAQRLREQLGHTWSNEVVTFELGATKPGAAVVGVTRERADVLPLARPVNLYRPWALVVVVRTTRL